MTTHVRDEPQPLQIESRPPHHPAAYSAPRRWRVVSAREARDLAEALMNRIDGEVRFDNGSRALYATDLSMYRQVPIGVVVPRHIGDVVETVAACRDRGVPILGRGCGTSLAGQTCNVAVVIDFSKYLNRVLDIDVLNKRARVEPGCIRDELNDRCEAHHLTFPPDPATHKYCTIGGMIGNNSCGVHSVMGGRTADNVEELEILTYDGCRMTVGHTSERQLQEIISAGGRRAQIYSQLRDLRDRYARLVRQRFPRIPRRVSGYNLDELLPEKGFHVAHALVGTESTCAITLSATVRLMHSPSKRALLVIAYPDIFQAADSVAEIRRYGPIGLEALQKHVLENIRRKCQDTEGAKHLPDGDTWLYAEFGGDTQHQADARARDAMERIRKGLKGHLGFRLISDPAEAQQVWRLRESGVGASRVPGVEDAWPSWEDAAVAPEVLGNYLRDFYKLLQKYEYKWTIYGHFGDGCVHTRITFDLKTREGVRNYRAFMEEAADLVVRYGGSLSGEHGDGQARAELLPKMFGPQLVQAFREFKAIWDPGWKMNPGKVVDPYKLDENLRVSPEHPPKPVLTYFKFPEDHGGFGEATERCFGVGKCRGLDGGTMCPSFMATREEMHTTRGRAHLLFEMLRGEAITGGWRDEQVKQSLDLCLSCKGCKGDCPVSVDIATYKAEFLAHYYERRLRPRSAYALGLVHRWARLGSHAPWLVNFVTRTRGLSSLAKGIAGMSQARTIPPLAAETFRSWFERHERRRSATTQVLLWADTFNNYFFPEVAKAAVLVLEDAGYEVKVPRKPLCCGRPLYDYGMLGRAKRQLTEIVNALRPALRSGMPFVVLEPSCLAVFKDELANLMPEDEDAQRLHRQSFQLAEFLQHSGHRPRPVHGKAIVHGHCHQKAVLGMKATMNMLAAAGLEADLVDSGCCGMAGSFGFERKNYDISMKVGERTLLPAVRAATEETIIVTDGFSCREQIAQATGRRALHTAEVLGMGLAKLEAASGPRASLARKVLRTAAVCGILAGAGLLTYRVFRAR